MVDMLAQSGRGHLVLRLIRGARPLVSLPLRLRGDASPVAANVARSLDDSADGGLAGATTATTHAVRRWAEVPTARQRSQVRRRVRRSCRGYRDASHSHADSGAEGEWTCRTVDRN